MNRIKVFLNKFISVFILALRIFTSWVLQTLTALLSRVINLRQHPVTQYVSVSFPKVWNNSHVRIIFLSACSLIIIGVGGIYSISLLAPSRPIVTWTMIDVSGTLSLGDAHLLEFSNGRKILIDTGRNENSKKYLVPFLQHKNIHSLDRIIVTNPAISKSGGVLKILESGITVGSINFNPPSEEYCNQVPGRPCHRKRILKAMRNWQNYAQIWPLQTDQIIVESENTRLSVLIAHDGITHTPLNGIIHDVTNLLILKAGNNKIIFASDLSSALGGYIADSYNDNLNFNILKVPHFGESNLAPASFFEKILPTLQLALIPTTEKSWAGKRASRARRMLENIPTYLSERHGNVEVRLFADKFEIEHYQHPRY
ncbi:MAG: beta-lactamase superfamily II metal-dependent hydrolase [Parasphingorhabdus sp.]|jgi:beta-lactamase superfamily II metal-dependent hydrolase